MNALAPSPSSAEKTLNIGPVTITGQVWLAPMAGVSDPPFREICSQLGASAVVGEMLTSDQRLWASSKSRRRFHTETESYPRIVQIAGSDPLMMAQAARAQVEQGAQIVDINMGCPAKKVCNRAAGSALLRDEPLVREILTAVVNAVSVPVTLKMRTGWDSQSRNGVHIAKMAQDIGVQSLTVHGRTRADRFLGDAEYDTIAEIKRNVRIPVIANGDIRDAEKALMVLRHTQADGVMIGRAAQGNPWILGQIRQKISTNTTACEPDRMTRRDIILKHWNAMIAHHGEADGVKISRKHLTWYRQRWLQLSHSEQDVSEEASLFSSCLKSDRVEDQQKALFAWLQMI
jgi:tRNA-dihydrouridine synthase B